jgi:hypothetical protein
MSLEENPVVQFSRVKRQYNKKKEKRYILIAYVIIEYIVLFIIQIIDRISIVFIICRSSYRTI